MLTLSSSAVYLLSSRDYTVVWHSALWHSGAIVLGQLGADSDVHDCLVWSLLWQLQKGVQSLPAAAAMYLSSLSERTPRSGTRLYDTAEPVSAADSIGQPLHHRWAAQCATGEAVFLDDIPPATSEILFLTMPTWPVALPCWGWGVRAPHIVAGPPKFSHTLDTLWSSDSRKKLVNLMPPDSNSVSTGALTQTPFGELTALPQTP